MADLTSANSVLTITIPGVYDSAQQLQGYSADDIFSVASVTTAETTMGLDGILSGGYVPAPRELSLTLQGDSFSNVIFDNWIQQAQTQRTPYTCSMTILVPSIGKAYTATRGFLKGASVLADAKKILQPRQYQIQFQSIDPAPTN